MVQYLAGTKLRAQPRAPNKLEVKIVVWVLIDERLSQNLTYCELCHTVVFNPITFSSTRYHTGKLQTVDGQRISGSSYTVVMSSDNIFPILMDTTILEHLISGAIDINLKTW